MTTPGIAIVDELPPANASYRGQMFQVRGDGGVADQLVQCVKLANDTYAYVDLLANDARYYTEAEVDALLAAVAATVPVVKRKAADQTNATATLAAVNDLTVTVAANETWYVEWVMRAGTSGTGGIEVGIWAPSGATSEIAWVGSMDSTTTGFTTQWTTLLNTNVGVWWMFNTTSQNGHLIARGVIANGANAGTVEFRFGPGNDTDTITIHANSVVRAQRIS